MKEKSINTIKWGIFSRLSDNEKILWLQLNWSPMSRQSADQYVTAVSLQHEGEKLI